MSQKKPDLIALAASAQQTAQMRQLRDSNARLARQLESEKAKTAELVDAVYRAAKDAAAGLAVPDVVKPYIAPSKRTKEVAIAVLSDWQLAKTTSSYNSKVCEKRIETYAEGVARLTEIQRHDHPVRELRVYLLGDLVEGEMIFPGQSHLIDASLYRQVMVDGPRILSGFLRRMLGVYESVKVVGVCGNHGALGGRARKEYHPETNADMMMYEATRMVLENQTRLAWTPNFTPGERTWYAVDQVGSKKFFMFHGDQIRGMTLGYPWYGFGKKLLAWQNHFKFDYSFSGHYHTPVRFQVGSITHWGNGSTESDNTYALESLAAQGEPNQWLLFAHPKRGVTAEYLVKL